jgi:hypothetical protein
MSLRLGLIFLLSAMGGEPLRFGTFPHLLRREVTERMTPLFCVEMEMVHMSAVGVRPEGRAKNLTSAVMDSVKKGTALIGGFPSLKYADAAAGRSDELAYVDCVGAGMFAELLRPSIIPHAAAIGREVRQPDDPRMEMQFGGGLHSAVQPLLQRFGEPAGYDGLGRKRKKRVPIAVETAKPYRSRSAADPFPNWRKAVIGGVEAWQALVAVFRCGFDLGSAPRFWRGRVWFGKRFVFCRRDTLRQLHPGSGYSLVSQWIWIRRTPASSGTLSRSAPRRCSAAGGSLLRLQNLTEAVAQRSP